MVFSTQVQRREIDPPQEAPGVLDLSGLLQQQEEQKRRRQAALANLLGRGLGQQEQGLPGQEQLGQDLAGAGGAAIGGSVGGPVGAFIGRQIGQRAGGGILSSLQGLLGGGG